jgi:hypothetical protein
MIEMFVKIHRHEDDVILAACDEDLVGKTFRGDGAKIDVSEIFYKGESVGREVLVERMKNVSIMNLVGEETVSIAIEQGYASKDDVIEIGGVKHVQVVLL